MQYFICGYAIATAAIAAAAAVQYSLCKCVILVSTIHATLMGVVRWIIRALTQRYRPFTFAPLQAKPLEPLSSAEHGGATQISVRLHVGSNGNSTPSSISVLLWQCCLSVGIPTHVYTRQDLELLQDHSYDVYKGF